MRPPQGGLVTVRRRTALLAAASLVLAALGLEAFVLGYPLGLALLAASLVQAGICSAMFQSRLLKALLGANLLLFVFHALFVSRFMGDEEAPAIYQLGDFACAVTAAASLVFTPVETMALIVRQAWRQRVGRPP
jgi:hypothetical protein